MLSQAPDKQRTRQFEFSRTREKSRSRTSRLISSNPVSDLRSPYFLYRVRKKADRSFLSFSERCKLKRVS